MEMGILGLRYFILGSISRQNFLRSGNNVSLSSRYCLAFVVHGHVNNFQADIFVEKVPHHFHFYVLMLRPYRFD